MVAGGRRTYCGVWFVRPQDWRECNAVV